MTRACLQNDSLIHPQAAAFSKLWHEATCAWRLEKHWAVAQVPINGSNTQLSFDACAQPAQEGAAAVRERPSSPATAPHQHTWNPNPLYRLGSYDPSAPDTQGTITDATTSPHHDNPFSSADAADAPGPGPASARTAEAQAAGSRCQHCRAHTTAHLAHALVEANASVSAARTQLLAAQADIALLLGKRVNQHPSLLCAAVCCQSGKLLTRTCAASVVEDQRQQLQATAAAQQELCLHLLHNQQHLNHPAGSSTRLFDNTWEGSSANSSGLISNTSTRSGGGGSETEGTAGEWAVRVTVCRGSRACGVGECSSGQQLSTACHDGPG